ncbi:MAG: DUF2846 domain-containing protein [Alphaproteobacteria bacterium]|nr:DUF2846 domain-containing protein [Alphaproteobacteria bacterium]
MRRLIFAMFGIIGVLALGACVQSPTASQSVLSLPPPQPGLGRVFFYRPGDIVGAWNQPIVLMNGRQAGQAKPARYFYIDAPPGNYVVQTVSDPNRRVSFALRPGTKVYVRLNNQFAGIAQVYPELVSEFEGLSGMQPLSYGG